MIPYREQKYICGKNYMDIQIFPVFDYKYKPKTTRAKKRKPSSAAQEVLNLENSRRKLSRLIKSNFDDKGFAGTATYTDMLRPDNAETARRDWQNFIRRVRRIYKKHNAEFKYIWAIEASEKTGNIHFHIILSGGVPREEIEDAWALGWLNLKRLRFDKNGVEGLLYYMTKDKPLLYRRWSGSKNLKKPIERKNDSRITFGRARKLYAAACTNDVEEFKKLYPEWSGRLADYDIAKIKSIHNENNGEYYLFVQLYRTS